MRTSARAGWLCLSVLVVVLVWAVTHGPAMVTRVPPPDDLRAETPPMAATPPPSSLPSASPAPVPRFDVPLWLGSAILGFFVVLVLIAAFAVWRWLRGRDLPRLPEGAPVPHAPPVLDEERAEEHRLILAQGEPRNAIVACWVELERLAAGAGVPRDPSETSSELARRVLSELDVPDEPVAALAEAYREARFSRHPVVEADRAAAAAALDEIHAALLGRQRA